MSTWKSKRKMEVSKRISKILRRKEQLVKEIWSEHVKNSTNITRIVPGRNAKEVVILDCQHVMLKTVAKDVMNFLISRSLLYIDRSMEKSVKARLCAVQ